MSRGLGSKLTLMTRCCLQVSEREANSAVIRKERANIMSSPSESSSSSSFVESPGEVSDSDTERDARVVNLRFMPYQDEPIGDGEGGVEGENGGEAEENADVDGLTARTLAARYRGESPVNEW